MKTGLFMFCIQVLVMTGVSFGWQAGELTVTVTESPMNIKVAAGTKTLMDITQISFGSSNYSSISSVSTTADSLVLNLASGVALTIKPVFSGIRFYGKVNSASSVKIIMKDQNDHFFGIAEQNFHGASPDLRTHTIKISRANMDNTSLKAEPYARLWSSFYMSSLGYGSFFDSFAEGTYAFGTGGNTSIEHNTNTIDWYIYYGPTGDKIHRAYFKTIQILENLGTKSPTEYVPIWACGLVVWNDNYSGSSQILGQLTNFTSNKIPLTALWADRPYSDGGSGWGQMNFSSSFPNPEKWIRQMRSDTGYNVKFMTWIAPATFGNPLPPAGTYFSGGYHYLDLSNPAAVSWYKERLNSRQHDAGVQGHKMDRCEENTGPVVSNSWADGTPAPQRQCKYLYLNAKVTDEILRAKWGDDHFNFARGAYNRTQPYNNAVWGGDSRMSWEGLQGALANGVKSSFMGFPVWGSDIGGYGKASKIPTDLYLRWLTFGCFSGFMECMLDSREPYIYNDQIDGESFVSRYKSVAGLRMSLIPYIYSLANTSADNGVLMRPLAYMYPDDANTYSIGSEFILGDALLVAPITSSGSMTRSIYLPEGSWYEFFNPAQEREKGTFTTPSIPLHQIPVYVKSNSLYLTGQIYPGNSKRWMENFDATRHLVINANPGNVGESTNFTYVDYLESDAKKTISLETISGTPNDIVVVQSPAMTIPCTVKVRLNTAPTSITNNNVSLSASQYQYTVSTRTLAVPVAAQQPIHVQINGSVGTADIYEIPKLLGKPQIRVVRDKIALVIPPASGLRNGSHIVSRIFDLRGRLIWKESIAPNRICASAHPVPLDNIGKGSYVATVEVDGIVVQRASIAVH